MNLYRNNLTLGSIPQLDVVTPNLFPLAKLMSYYPMDETSGSVMNDIKGSSNGSISNVTLNQTGKEGKAYQFSGSSSYVNTTITIPAATSATKQSYSVWVYFDGSTVNVLGSDANSTGKFHLYCQLEASKFTFGGSYYGGSSGESDSIVNMTITTGWHLVCVSKTAAYYFDVYFDKVKVIAGAYRVATQPSTLYLGMSYANAYYSGKQDELAVFNDTLTQEDVDMVWNNGLGFFYRV